MRLLHVVLVFLCASGVVRANIESAPGPIEDRFEEATLVCTGRVLSTGEPSPWPLTAGGKLAVTQTDASVEIMSLYKGTARENSLRVIFPETDPMAGVPVGKGKEYLFFFGPKESGGWRLMVDSGSLTAVTLLRGKWEASMLGLEQLQSDIALTAGSVGQPQLSRALELLLQFRLLDDRSVHIVEGIHLLQKEDVLTRLTLLATFRPEEYRSPFLRTALTSTPQSPVLLNAMTTLIHMQTTPKDVPALETLATSAEMPFFRLVAMWAIRRLKPADAVPFLISQLDADDIAVSYLAVISLAEQTEQFGNYAPSMPIYEEDPPRYQQLWKSWWASKRR